jgi:site-specific DNA-methyltransferase (adenine-specific)
MIQITNEDNMELMLRYPDRYFDLAFIDPPYGLPKGSVHGRGILKDRALNKMSAEMVEWDKAPPPEFFEGIFRIADKAIIFGGNYFALPPTRGIAIWDKRQPWENFSQFEYIWTSYDKPAHIFTVANTGGLSGDEKKIHPTQKPVILLKKILQWYGVKPGSKIIDTGTGSGSLAIACLDIGIDIIGCEKNEGYYNASMAWIKEHQQQQDLFEKAEITQGKTLFSEDENE